MKSTGIVRKIDELGRIVLPIEIRNTLDIKPKDSIEIFVDDDKISAVMHFLREFRLCDSIPWKTCMRRLYFSYQAFHCSVKAVSLIIICKIFFQL